MNSPISTPEPAFVPLSFDAVPLIESYGPGFLRIGTHILRGPLLIAPVAPQGSGALTWRAQVWGGTEDIGPLLSLIGQIDVLLFGGGATLIAPPRPLRVALEDAGLALDPMSTASAARAYNFLVAEGRRVALAALPIAPL